MSVVMTITGIEEVQRFLRDAPKLIVAKGFLKAMQAAATVVADEVEILVPVKAVETGGGNSLDKGELRDSLMIAYQMDSQLRGIIADVGFPRATSHVALWLEYGHRLVGHRPGRKLLGFVRPFPFLRPAADLSFGSAVEAFAESLAVTIKTEFP